MTEPCCDWLHATVNQYHGGRTLALFFDYDGTLTPIVRHPSLARMSDATRHHLRHLAELPRVRVGVISGRALSEVRLMVGLQDIYYAGSGGLDLDLRGRYQCDPELNNSALLFERIQDRLVEILRQNPGTWFERKPGAIAIHFRDLLPLNAASFRYDVASVLAGIETVKFCVATQTIEITPRNGGDKGTAVKRILNEVNAECGQRPLAIYFGDADNDTEGMLAVKEAGGTAVGIGRDHPAIAQHHLADPSNLTDCLGQLCDLLSRHEESDSLHRNDRVIHGDILLVDPDSIFRQQLASGLNELGWRVWQTDTVEHAENVLEQHGQFIRVAIVDLLLPGFQSSRNLVDWGARFPGLIRCMIGTDIRHDIATAYSKSAAIPVFVKPFDAWELHGNLKDLLAA